MAQASTRLLRAGADPLYAKLRDLLSMKGVDPSTCVLAAFFPDDTNMEFGVVVTPDHHVYEFDLVYGSGDVAAAVEGAYFGDWRDRTAWWPSTPSRADIEEAMAMLDRA